ncbi:FtsX-like permease family protein [Vibrio parahaemolyticus]|uniref:FtsX-like permease family protein n=1 Tax=Vibrio mediterranei TaxID=689 RepID=UPI004068151F
MLRTRATHVGVTLKLFVAHYRQAPLQAAAILIGIVLAVTLFVAVQAINLNAKRSYSEATEQLSAQASNLIIPASGQRYLSESLYFSLRQSGVSGALPVLEGRVRDELGRRFNIQGSDLVAAITARLRYQDTDNEGGVGLFSSTLPLADLLAGRPVVMMSQDRYKELGSPSRLTLDGVITEVKAVPDEWQLGSRLLTDIGFAQQLLNKKGQLSYIALFESNMSTQKWESLLGAEAQWVRNTKSSDLGSLTDSFHLNLTAMSMLAFIVGLFIAYNGVKYSLLKRNRLLVQLQQAGVTATIALLCLLIELCFLVTVGTTIGFVLGIQLSHWLHPTVALTLEQLYGATLLPGTWKWQWWAQALIITLMAALLACWQHLKQHVDQPLSSHGGFYQLPMHGQEKRLFVIGVLLLDMALIGVWVSDNFRLTMFWLGMLIIAMPLLLPKSLSLLAQWAQRRTSSGLVQYMFAELRELVAPLSLAMMALLLAVTANMGMNTLVGSFESTLKQWLEQRLHADIYVSPSQSQMSDVERALEQFEGVEQVYKQFYVRDSVLGLPVLLGTKDATTLEQTMVFKSSIPGFWPQFYSGKVVAISEPMSVKLKLTLGSELPEDVLPDVPLNIGAIFHDYGSPNGEVLIAPTLWLSSGFSPQPTSLGVKVSADKEYVYQQLIERLDLHPNQLYDQAQIKSIALGIFSRTFAVTSALNGVTLMVAVVGLFTACFMMFEARKAAIARLYALGVRRSKLMALVVGQIAVLVLFTLMLALPLGSLVGYVLTDMVTLRAFGWSLDFHWNWRDAVSLAVITLGVSVIATLLPLWRLVNKPVLSSLQSEVL